MITMAKDGEKERKSTGAKRAAEDKTTAQRRYIYTEGERDRKRGQKVLWLRFRAGGGARLSLPYIRTINEAFSRP